MTKTGISRRRFMKVGLSFAACSSLNMRVFSQAVFDKKNMAVSRTSLKELTAIPTTCLQCPAACGVIAYLNGERLVQILGNPDHPNNKGGICAKGVGGINLVNDPERLLYPLKRIGPRGSNKWTKITWDEAYQTLVSRLHLLMKKDRMNEFVIDMGQTDPLLVRFARALGDPSVINRTLERDLNRSSALARMTGHPFLIPDVGRTRFIMNFGANPFANHEYFIGLARRLVQARMERGARLVTFDIRMSETAAKSDEWYPLKSGTDASVALAMAHVIVDKGMIDRAFLAQNTNISITLLKEHLSTYTPAWAESISGIKAREIERLAVEFAGNRPSLALIGGGVADHENGHQTTKCIFLLNWMAGNLEKEGGFFFPRFPGMPEPLSSYGKIPGSESEKTIHSISDLEEQQNQVDTYFSYRANPAYSDANGKESIRILKDENLIPFLAVMDTHMTETAILADLVLPSATYLEGWGVLPAPSLDGIPILNLRQPAVSMLSPAKALRSPAFDTGKILENRFQPRGEALEIGNLCLRLAEKIGGDLRKNLPFKNTLDYVNKMISSSIDSTAGRSSFKRTGIWIDDKETTKSGIKPNRTSDKVLVSVNSASLPDYVPVSHPVEKTPDRFTLTPYKTNLGTRGMENSKWAREILHENRLWMNKERALRLKLKNGDKVLVSSAVGSLTTTLLTTELIHPDSVALAEGLGHTAFGKVAQAQKFRSKDRDTRLIWWGKKGKGTNPYTIIEPRVDPEGEGQATKDTVVRVQKIEE
jgi:thiosulfate reductase/polysulfide reductase chain A